MLDYLSGDPRAGSYYAGHFRDPEAYREKAREVDLRFDREGRERAASLISSPFKDSSQRLDAFVEEGGYLVTTGQQPGLFTGPLYSLYKALTAVRLAETLESVLGKPVLPLFWMASEDHDWEEADHTHLLDAENQVQTFRLPTPEGLDNRPLHRIPLDQRSLSTVEAFLQTLPQNEFSAPFINSIRRAFEPGQTIPGGYRSVLEDLLSELPLFYVDAAFPALKEASLPILLQALEGAGEQEGLLSGVASRLDADGYSVQVPILDGGVNLFLEGTEGRDRLYRQDAQFRLNRAGTRLSLEDVQAIAGDDPTLLSPNVLMRPVVESSLFPTVSYVAGPGELAYFAQLKDLFQLHGILMPVIHPRHSVTLLETKIGKVLDKFHLSPQEVNRPFHELAADIAKEEMPPEIRRALGELRGAIGKGAGALLKAAQGVDSTLKGPVGQARNTALGAFDDAERKILQAIKRENEITLGQLEKAQRNLYPLGKPQERILNPFYYLTRYGKELIPALLATFDVALGTDSA